MSYDGLFYDFLALEFCLVNILDILCYVFWKQVDKQLRLVSILHEDEREEVDVSHVPEYTVLRHRKSG